ncbi:DUF2867 domain-containing protein [Bacillus sp. NP157]|nr:DUF2867 domain-containing protein [Bacillus sp. NP157]
MSSHAESVASFPSISIPSAADGPPVEVSLIAQLGHGAGSQLVAASSLRQRAHAAFVDELDEPSAKLAGTHFEHDDPSSLYTFAVGAKGHPFHRHAGHRIFTAVSGSSGALLRFCTATAAQLADDPTHFLRALRHVEIPPDSLFTVRFGGGTWHQFQPLRAGSGHPAFFALSCHTNELGGDLPDAVRQQVLDDGASIPSLTELLPDAVQALLDGMTPGHVHVPTASLSLEAAPGSLQVTLCGFARRTLGKVRALLAGWGRGGGFLSRTQGWQTVVELDAPDTDSLLREQFAGAVDHEDGFRLVLAERQPRHARASVLLADLLDAFMKHPPGSVSRLMALRNLLVMPLGLRRSPLACPVSSLLAPLDKRVFAGRFPVLDQRIDGDDSFAQVILGADDKHLSFRSCVALRVVDGRVDVTLGTRVRCRNAFGRVYLGLIDRVHRRYVSPLVLRGAVAHAFPVQDDAVLRRRPTTTSLPTPLA